MASNPIVVRAEWDPEAGVYAATSDDVPGLVAEAPTPDALRDKLSRLIPELLMLNGVACHADGQAARSYASFGNRPS